MFYAVKHMFSYSLVLKISVGKNKTASQKSAIDEGRNYDRRKEQPLRYG